MATPLTAFRIPDAEKAELAKLAKARGVTLTEAYIKGARMYLESKEKVARAA